MIAVHQAAEADGGLGRIAAGRRVATVTQLGDESAALTARAAHRRRVCRILAAV